MGLLEKALEFKNKVNKAGQTTLMDKIKGPADGGPPLDINSKMSAPDQENGEGGSNNEIVFLDTNDLEVIDSVDVEEIKEADAPGVDISGLPAGESAASIEQESGVTGKDKAADLLHKSLKKKKGKSDPDSVMDYMALFEIGKEIVRSDTRDSFIDTILFSIMGQIGVSSASVMIPDSNSPDLWEIVGSRGVNIVDTKLDFKSGEGILGELLKRKEVLDCEEFKNHPELSGEYYQYIAIDARLLVPLIADDAVLGVVILGELLSGRDYLSEEKDFIIAIADFSASVLKAILEHENKLEELSGLEKDIGHITDAERIYQRIKGEEGLYACGAALQEEFSARGILSYAVFINNERKGHYDVLLTEREDSFRLKVDNFFIPEGALMIKKLSNAGAPLIYESFQNEPEVIEAFTGERTQRFSVLKVFPFRTGKDLNGFLSVFKADETISPEEFTPRLARITENIFPHFFLLYNSENFRGTYVDNVEHIYRRIERELENAKNLNIPLTMALISIKNYKRYFSLFGYEKIEELIEGIEALIKKRLSDWDFCIRYDKNKILMVLPGKDEEYATPLVSSISKEAIESFSTPEMRLLITHLQALYPRDGKDIYTVLNFLD